MANNFLCSRTEPIVQTKAGKLRGFKLNSTYHFRGIKYCDAERFHQPKPVAPWEGIKNAVNYGYICPIMRPFDIDKDLSIPHRFWATNEHCQYLNVWTQSLDSSVKKPVMVWLHGGGFAEGSSIEMTAYEGYNLSEYGDVVVVTINHRLNMLGFLDLSAYGEQYENSGNAGMADIVAALKWINENIAGFGGDPDNVTVFGQSGGGMKVTSLLQIPEASGLFHKGIVQSGIAGSKNSVMPAVTEEDSRAVTAAMLVKLGIKTEEIEKIETVPQPALVIAFNEAIKELNAEGKALTMGGLGSWGPKVNDYFLGNPLEVGFSEYAKKVPLMAGTVIAEFSFHRPENSYEMSEEEQKAAVAKKFGAEHLDEILSLFEKAYPGKPIIDILYLDSFFRQPTIDYLNLRSQIKETPIYSYLFTFTFPYTGGRPAWHCAEIPFVFHNTDLVEIYGIPGVSDRLEEEMAGAWVNFARTGNPNHANLTDWPAYDETHPTLIFDESCEIRNNHGEELIKAIAKYAPPFKMPSFEPKDDKKKKDGEYMRF